MKLFPAIDLYEGKAVRLFLGNYNEITVYNDDPLSVAKDFEAAGMSCVHLVDLEGAKNGTTPNIDIIKSIAENTSLFVEVGGGIRNMETVEKYISCGVDRVILGTAAVTDEEFLVEAIKKHGDRIAVGADVKDGYIAIKGWLESSQYTLFEFFEKMQKTGVKYIICTDISKDGAMRGTNLAMYSELSRRFDMCITASGGVSSLQDVELLNKMGLYGAIIGKAYYTGAISLKEAAEVVK